MTSPPEVPAVLRQPALERPLREHVHAHRREVALGLLRLLLPLDDAVLVVEREHAHAATPRRSGRGGRRSSRRRASAGGPRGTAGSPSCRCGRRRGRAPCRPPRSTTLMFWSTASAVPPYHSATRPRLMYGWSILTPPVLRSRSHGRPEPDVVVERARVVLGQDDDVVDARVHAVRQREVDDPVLAAERDRGLGAHRRQDREALALAAREDDGDHRLDQASSLRGPAVDVLGC